MTQDADKKDWANIREAAYAAKLAYMYSQPQKYKNQPDLVKQVSQRFAGYKIQMVRKDNVLVLLAAPPTPDKPAFIAFAGSDDGKDWFEDFIAVPSLLNKGNHLGFDMMYSRVNPESDPVITRFIEDMERQGIPIYVSGHSMGGALATLCGQEHGEEHELNIVTLNAPSTGLQSARHIDSLQKLEITNFVKKGDLVSMGGTGSLAGDTYIISDQANFMGNFFMVEHSRMSMDTDEALKRFAKNFVGAVIPRHNPVTAHSSDNMLGYIEVMAEKNMPDRGVTVRLTDQPQAPLFPSSEPQQAAGKGKFSPMPR